MMREEKMFALVRFYIKTSLLFLVLGMGVGLWALLARDLLRRPVPFLLASAHGHLILVGFVVMLVMGVSVWMFPRPAKGDERYSEAAATLVYWTMTVSVSCRFFSETALAYGAIGGLRWLSLAAACGELFGAALFVYNLWPRIRPAVRP